MKVYNEKGELLTTKLTKAQILELLGVIEAEVNQLKTLDTTTISAAQWAITGALTTDPIGGDGTAGRILRHSVLTMADGSNASTLKNTIGSRWNGNAIAETDNISKNVITGDYFLSGDGKTLLIKASGLTGNAVDAFGMLTTNNTGTVYYVSFGASANNIQMVAWNASGVAQDMTSVVDSGSLTIEFYYITTA